MKRKSISYCYSFVMLLFITVSALAQQERKVAVFDPAGKVEEALLEIVREEISSVVVNTTGYTVLERQLINKVLEENKFQESGLVNDEQVSDIGKRMGADYVFVTTISPLGGNYYISCKMIEVATARIEKQSTGTTTAGINDIPQTTQYIVRRLFGEDVQQQVYGQRQQTTATQRDVAAVNRQSGPAENPYSLPVSSKETTIRKGFEIQSDVMYMYLPYSIITGFRMGANLSINYRIKQKLAFGIGICFFTGVNDSLGNSNKLSNFFFNIIYNFKETKFSPYVALEVGEDRLSYYSYYQRSFSEPSQEHKKIDYGFSIGVVTGIQYSFNDHFALKANLKGFAVTNYDNAYKIGIGVGAIYHF